MKSLSFAVGLLLTIAGFSAHAETYYISSTGSDTNSGSSKTLAWASIDKVNATRFAAGDTVLFEGEVIFSGSIYFGPDVKGTPELPIVIGSFGVGRAVISSGTEVGLSVYNSAGFKIQDLVFQGSGRTTNGASGVDFYMDLPSTRLPYIAIHNVEVYGYRESGISIGSWNGTSGFDDVSITHCSAHDNGDAGISTWADENKKGHRNVYLSNNKVYNNAGISTKTHSHSGNGIVMGGVDGGIIEYCEAYNNGWLNAWTSGGPVGIWCYVSNNVVIQYNESHHNKTGTSKDGGGFDIDGGSTNCIMQYNYSHDNEGAGFLLAQYSGAPAMQGLTIRYNISENDGRKNGYSAIHLWSSGSNGGIQDAQIYNNTIYMTAPASGAPKAVWVQNSGTAVATFRNNLFVTTGGVKLLQVDSKVTANVKFEGNNYWASGVSPKFTWGATTYTSLEAWRTATTQESTNGAASGHYLDPKLKNPGKGITISDPRLLFTLEGYKLDRSSALIGKALNLQIDYGLSIGKTDFWGNSISQRNNLCIGAHQVTNNSKACLYGGPQLLTFGQTDSPGVYAGNGVTKEGYFTPEAAGVGSHALVYTYTDAQGQQQAVHYTISVIDTDATEWTGNSGTPDWFDSQNWSACVPTPHINASIPPSEQGVSLFPSIESGEHGYVNALNAAGPLTIGQNATLELHGNLVATNLSTDLNSSIIFNSDTTQLIPAGSYGSLVLQGSGAKTLAGAATINNLLDLNQSKLLLGDNSLLIKEGGKIFNYNADHYILTNGAGQLTYAGMATGTTKVYPVGTAKGYAPVSLQNKGIKDAFSIRVEDRTPTEQETAEKESTINKTWHIDEREKGGSDVTMTLQWATNDEPETFNRSESYVSHFEDNTWQVMESSTGMVTQGATAGTYQISLSGVNSFSPFTVASTQSVPTPMPVTLASFTAAKQGAEVVLEWVTASEQNNYGFDVEMSADGKSFRKPGFVKSKSPTSARRQLYTYRDQEAGKTGTTYYRLRQIDLDSTITYSFIRAVDFKQARLSFSAYPNPFSETVTLELETEKAEDLILTITDTKGKKLVYKSIPVQQGLTRLPLNLSELKESSYYILTASFSNKTYRFKLLKQ
ncbi:right-handed parallel beta-helix repeat-containing protein [uncultured Pontibacter sp.]|uniref:T9SS type A sorting domain-containing protein n=1 Tax=uncultured Pontibacter sp. TaxID=453356 RepID=UPI0026354EDF|nr:right-handed parallel beta-helix repeat-containing protein [uncultured Pontibacter sp.]